MFQLISYSRIGSERCAQVALDHAQDEIAILHNKRFVEAIANPQSFYILK